MSDDAMITNLKVETNLAKKNFDQCLSNIWPKLKILKKKEGDEIRENISTLSNTTET